MCVYELFKIIVFHCSYQLLQCSSCFSVSALQHFTSCSHSFSCCSVSAIHGSVSAVSAIAVFQLLSASVVTVFQPFMAVYQLLQCFSCCGISAVSVFQLFSVSAVSVFQLFQCFSCFGVSAVAVF